MPSLAEAPASAGRSSAVRWFTTCQYVEMDAFDNGPTRQPASTAHAKQMGTPLTACGLTATSWHRLWELPFGAGSGTYWLCPTCVGLVGDGSRRGS